MRQTTAHAATANGLRARLATRWGSRIAYSVFPILLLIGLLLPPVSLAERIAYRDFTPVARQGGVVTDGNGAQIAVAPGAIAGKLYLKLTSVDPAHLETSQPQALVAKALAALPAGARIVGPLYRLDAHGAETPKAEVSLPVPTGVEAAPSDLDVYAWSSQGWHWVPGQIEGTVAHASLASLPLGVALMAAHPANVDLACQMPADAQLSDAAWSVVSVVNPTGLYLQDDGSIGGQTASRDNFDQRTAVLPTVSNRVDGIIRSDWTDNLLIDPTWRDTHIATLVDLVVGGGYDGVDLDYRDVDPTLRPDFTAFVQALADQLHAQGKQLSLTLLVPAKDDQPPDTGAADYRALGQAADRINLLGPAEAPVYAQDGPMSDVLRYAVSQIDRNKIRLALSSASRDLAGDKITWLSYSEALKLASAMTVSQATGPVVTGEAVTLDVPALSAAGGLRWDDAAGNYTFRYTDASGQAHSVYLEDATSLAGKMALAARFNLGGIALRDLAAQGNDVRLWPLLADFHDSRAAQARPADYRVVWTVQDPAGQPIAEVTAAPAQPQFVLTAEVPGEYVVSAAISADGGQTLAGQPSSHMLQVEAPTPTPTNTPTPTPILPDAVVSGSEVNLRAGPGTVYDIVDKLTRGVELTVIGRTEDGQWFEVKPKDGTPGWISADLIDLNGEVDDFPVSQNIPPTPTPRPTNTPQPTAVAQAQPTSGPALQQQLPAAPPPSAVGTVGYGIQVDMLTDSNHARILDHVKDLGFNWIKQQVEWFRVEPNKGQYDWGGLDRIVDSANAYGINVLFSVVKAPRWARPGNSDFSVEGPPANPQDFADFLRAMAAHYKGRVRAYEVWNEQNLWYEWGHEPLDAGRYVQLLAAAYRGIKAGDPGAIVVSGALTPTGVNDGVIGVDDALYLERMYQAGLKNYCDVVGVHPSGYNNPATAFAESWSDPSAPSFKGHRSFFFRSTVKRYREIMNAYGDGAKRLWATEFGWASVENMGAGPAAGYGYAADNTEAEQAQFLVDAFQIGRQYGVGVMFVWNLNFAPITGPGDEKAAFSIVRSDWSPRPAYAALRDMPK